MKRRSEGSGQVDPAQFGRIGEGVVLEPGVLVFFPESIEIGDNVYVGHGTILKGYYQNRMVIGEGSWIGQQCFFHSAGGLTIGREVGVGIGVKIWTSNHRDEGTDKPIIRSGLRFAAVVIGDGADIGVGAIVLPGVTIGIGCQIGAGSVVTGDIPPYCVAAGAPARVLRSRR